MMSHRLKYCAVLSVGFILGAGSAHAEIYNHSYRKILKPNETILLRYFSTDNGPARNCTSTPANVVVVQRPSRGRTAQREEIRRDTVPLNGRPNGCEGASQNVRAVYYRADPDFSGHDQVRLGWSFPNGTQVFEVYDLDVVPGVDAPASVAKPIETPASQPPPEKGTRVAPTERRTASDFFSGTAKGARTDRSEAAPATSTNAADFFSGLGKIEQPTPDVRPAPTPSDDGSGTRGQPSGSGL